MTNITPEEVAGLVKRLRGWVKDIQEGSTAIYAMDRHLKSAASCIEALAARVVELEAAADTYGPQGMWRFWNDKALSLAEKLTAADASLALVTAGRDTLSRRLDRADARIAHLEAHIEGTARDTHKLLSAAEAENARLVDAIKDTALFLDQMHTARMTGLGRDPVKYTSELSTHRDKLAALTTKEQNK
jgi:chromosome segregation ATPase